MEIYQKPSSSSTHPQGWNSMLLVDIKSQVPIMQSQDQLIGFWGRWIQRWSRVISGRTAWWRYESIGFVKATIGFDSFVKAISGVPIWLELSSAPEPDTRRLPSCPMHPSPRQHFKMSQWSLCMEQSTVPQACFLRHQGLSASASRICALLIKLNWFKTPLSSRNSKGLRRHSNKPVLALLKHKHNNYTPTLTAARHPWFCLVLDSD